MNSFEMTIQSKSESGDWPLVVDRKRPDEPRIRSTGVLQFQATDFDELYSLLDNPKKYGTFLGQAIFKDKIRDEFKRALESGQTVRIFVDVQDKALRVLRWERLCAPTDRGWDFLALDQRLFFSLYVPTAIADRRFQPIQGPEDLRALVVVASPEEKNLSAFDVHKALSSVQESLGQIPCDVLANGVPGAKGTPTLEQLCCHLTEKPYSILHIVSHGRLLDNGETLLYWADENNQTQRIPATQLLNELTRITHLPHLAFLSTCESASPTAESSFGGLGQRLVRELGLHAVVAMTERITVKTALTLGKQFYQRLKETGEVDLALCEATTGLTGRDDVVVPALFSRLGERSLFTQTIKQLKSQRPAAHQSLVYYLINRDHQEFELKEAIEKHYAVRENLKRPLLCLMHGDEREYDKFLERLQYVLPKMLPHSASSTPQAILMDGGQVQDIAKWQKRLLYSLQKQVLEPAETLGMNKAQVLKAIAQKLAMKPYPVILHTSLYPEDGLRKLQLIKEGFITFWADWPIPTSYPRTPLLLVCLFFKYRHIKSQKIKRWWPLPWPRSRKQKIDSFFRSLEELDFGQAFSVNGVVLPKLTSISKHNVEEWLEQYYQELKLGDPSEMKDKIDDIYQQHPTEKISMRELVKQLRKEICHPFQN